MFTTWVVLLSTNAVPVLLAHAAQVLVSDPGLLRLLEETLPEIQAALAEEAEEAARHLPPQTRGEQS
ncbi:hypothetical protein ACFXEL_06870 [Streptomyces sp. NPDC059382]|uniref:hypothetical protein n=1 Tax=Streptomyces sp. NPDC059382 TaxID=3346816 RepID=UPI003698E85F